MTGFADMFTLILAVGAVCLAVVAFAMVLATARPHHQLTRRIKHLTGSFIFIIGLAAVLAATAASLIYSEGIGYVPCELCWYQRIALYPQVIIFAVGLVSRGRELLVSSFVLSAGGVVAATAHVITQAVSNPALFCDGSGAVSCSELYFHVFGFISFPVLSLVIFIFLLVIVSYALWHYRDIPSARTKGISTSS